MDDERYFPCNSLVNLREIGGLPTQDGRRIKSRRLFRSADLSHLTAADHSCLQQLHIRLVCDLRSAQERQANPNRLPQDWAIRTAILPIDAQIQGMTRRQVYQYFIGRTGSEEYAGFVRRMYHSIAFDHTAQVKNVFDLIADENNLPMLIHCTAGKDRTGFLAALIQLSVGVSRSLALEDYLLTNRYYEPQMQRYARRIRWMTLFRAKPERIRHIFAAKQEYLEKTLDEIIQTYGTIAGYLRQACGLPEGQILALQKSLLEDKAEPG